MVWLTVFVAIWPVSAWDFMLVAGVIHKDWWPLVPPMGVGAAFTISGLTTLFAFLIGVMVGFLRGLSGATD